MSHSMLVLRKVLTVLLLLAIMPATLHCALENAGIVKADNCCSSMTPDTGSHEKCADSCETLESNGFHFKKDDAIQFPVIAFAAYLRLDARVFYESLSLIPFEEAVVFESKTRWQFVQRTAALARSPSILS